MLNPLNTEIKYPFTYVTSSEHRGKISSHVKSPQHRGKLSYSFYQIPWVQTKNILSRMLNQLGPEQKYSITYIKISCHLRQISLAQS